MENIVCKIATLDEIIKKFDYEIEKAKYKDKWIVWKNEAIKNHNENKTITYILKINDEIIGEAHAAISKDACQNSDGLVDHETAYLFAFRINDGFRGRHLFTKLYNFLEQDLKKRGYKKLTLGVEGDEEIGKHNLKIYKHYGFNTYIKTAYEEEPLDSKEEKPFFCKVNYYLKKLY